jgi:hypothetical protein
MVLATYRDTETGGREPLRQTLAALASESVTRLRLVGLTEPEVETLLSGIAGSPVQASVSSAANRRTQGNPFFVAELARVVADAGGEELPDGVRDAVCGRLDRLSPWCRQVVSAAARSGPLWTHRRWPPRPTAEARFGHDLIRETARLEVPTVRRLGLHQRMAEHLSSRVADILAVDGNPLTGPAALHRIQAAHCRGVAIQ